MRSLLLPVVLLVAAGVCAAQEAKPPAPEPKVVPGRCCGVPGGGKYILVSPAKMQDRYLSGDLPAYPEALRHQGLGGQVIVKMVVGRDGGVSEPRLYDGDPDLAQVAVEAVKSWHYKPFELADEPVPVETGVVFQFNVATGEVANSSGSYTKALFPKAAEAAPQSDPAKPKTQVIAQASDRPDSGRVANDAYTSDFFGFSMALPPGWQVEDREALQKSVDESYRKLYGSDPQAQAAGREAAARAYMLLSAEGRVAEEAVPSQVQIAAEQLPEDSGVESGKDYLDAVGAQPAIGGLEMKPLHEPAEVKLGGQPFWRQDYSAAATIAKKPVAIAYAEYVSIQKGYALILSFWTDTPEHLAALVKYADSVRFLAPAGETQLPK